VAWTSLTLLSSTAAGGLRQLLISPTDMHGFEHLFTRM
jgi:hypothetical protein